MPLKPLIPFNISVIGNKLTLMLDSEIVRLTITLSHASFEATKPLAPL